jgi:hypothetical protein
MRRDTEYSESVFALVSRHSHRHLGAQLLQLRALPHHHVAMPLPVLRLP